MNFIALYKKETRAYFNTPTAYIVTVVFLLITGYFFAQPFFLVGQASISSFTEMAPLLLVFFIPAVTMKLLSEELKSGTIEILMTLPVEDYEILLSKYASALTLVLFTLASTLVYPATAALLGNLDWGAALGAYLGLFLSGAVLASIGLFTSTWTRNQITAYILGFLIAFCFFLLGKAHVFMPLWLAPVTDFLGLDSHLDNISRGVLDTRDLGYYLSLSGFFLFLSYLNLSSRRWR